MKPNRKEEIIACCGSIIRNVDKIVDDFGHDRNLCIVIKIDAHAQPTVTVQKEIVPQELIALY